jgi:peptide-methionine (R)-S-oxide reductase
MDRRQFLVGALAIVPAAVAGCAAGAKETSDQRHAAGKVFEVSRTEEEWRKVLTPAQFRVLREHDTERAGSSPLDGEKRRGTFHCAGCDTALFSSDAKFDSGTGWPSFTAPLAGAIGTSIDRSLFDIRTEVHCARCGGHLGHVFDDGPRPTGKRYCMNGVALAFKLA